MSDKLWPADKVERRALADLMPYARNSRTHTPDQVSQIAASIREWGWTTPILVDETGRILAGHGRVLAAEEIGLTEVPVMVAAGWTEAQKRAYTIADNKLALNAEWNDELLKLELHALAEAEFPLDLMGFDPSELTDLMFKDLEPAAGDAVDAADVSYVIQFNIVFDNEAQQEAWFGFVRHLKTQYADLDTLGERLEAFIREGDFGAN